MSQSPSPNEGCNGRGVDGKFLPGNRLGRGNPHGQRVNDLRTALFAAVTAEDVEEIVAALVKAAKEGDIAAAREVLDRTIGKPAQSDVLARLEALEQAIAERGQP